MPPPSKSKQSPTNHIESVSQESKTHLRKVKLTNVPTPKEETKTFIKPGGQEGRMGQIKAAMSFAWNNYKEHAWGADELKPVSGEKAQAWGDIAVSMVDALDTLWIMDLKVCRFCKPTRPMGD